MEEADKNEENAVDNGVATVQNAVDNAVDNGVATVQKNGEEKASKKGAEKDALQQAEQVKAKAKKKNKNQKTSEGPTDAEVKKWIKENPFECDFPGCDKGEWGRPYRCEDKGYIGLHKYNKHGVESEDKKEEGKEKKKVESKGEDIMEDIVKRTEAADLRGKLTVAIKRITRLGPNDREALEPELAMVKSWKHQSLKKDITDEELNYIESELISIILPVIKDTEAEAKKDKKKAVEKTTKRTEDDDDDFSGSDEIRERIKSSRLLDQLDELDERKEQREQRRQRRERREEEDHQTRIQALKGGGGTFGGGNPMGTTFIQEIVPEYDEEGNMIKDASGQPRAKIVRQIPVNPNAIVQSQGRGGDGGSDTLKVLETYHKLTGGDKEAKEDVLKELKEDRKDFMDKIEKMTLANTTKEIYGDMNKLAGAISEINKKLDNDDDDGLETYIAMQDKLKEHNISVDGSSSPEVRKIDLEIEKEKTRRSMDMLMMGKTIKLAETAIKQVTDGPMAKAFAKKIDQSDIIAEEEELTDEDMAEIEEEVAPQQEEQPPPPDKRGKRKKRA